MSSTPQDNMATTTEEQFPPIGSVAREDEQHTFAGTEPSDFGTATLLWKEIAKVKHKITQLEYCHACWSWWSRIYTVGLEATRPWPTLDCLDSSSLREVSHIITQDTESKVELSKVSNIIAEQEETINRIETLLAQIQKSKDAKAYRSLIEQAEEATRAGYATIKKIRKEVYEDAFSRG